MSRKAKVLVSVMVVMLLLTVGIAVPAMAQEEPAPTPEPGTKIFMVTANTTGLLARVAEILDISEEDLINAFKQAWQEMRQEAFSRALDKAVEEGLLTQDEAEEIKEWWGQKPEVLDRGLLRRAFGSAASGANHMQGVRWGMQSQIRQRICQEMNGEWHQPEIRQQWQEMRQRAWQEMNRAWHQLEPSWLAD